MCCQGKATMVWDLGKEEDRIPRRKGVEVSWWVIKANKGRNSNQHYSIWSWTDNISICSYKHVTLWHLTDFFALGNVAPIASPRLLKPLPCIIHIHQHSFLLMCKSLDVLGGLLHRTLFEGHFGMWRDVIQTWNNTSEERKKERKEKERKGLVVEHGALTDERPITGWVSSLCAGGGGVQGWHLQTANKAVRLRTLLHKNTWRVEELSQQQQKCSTRLYLSTSHMQVHFHASQLPKNPQKGTVDVKNPHYIKRQHSSTAAAAPPTPDSKI